MIRCFSRIFLTYCLVGFGLAGRANAQAVVRASVDETTIGLDDVARYTIQIAGIAFSQITNPSPPTAEGLDLVQRAASTQQNLSIVNSQVEQSISFTWQFRPQRVGKATIAPATVEAGGQRYTTDPITISVVPQGQRPRRSAAPGGQVETPGLTEEDVFIRAEPAGGTVFQNQQLVLTYMLYFRSGVLLRNSRLADSWDTEGFWREDLEVEQRATMRTEIINGLRYNAVMLKRVALFPTRSGELTVEPLRIESEVALPRGSSAFRSLLFDRAARFQSASVESPSVVVVTKPLPNPPPNFRGVVGDLSIRTSVNRTEVEAGEPIQYTVVLSGRGNVATLAEPPLELPPLIERFGPEITDSIDRSGNYISGSKTFVYTLVPRSGGRHTIPGFSIPFFNPATGEYGSLDSPSVAINVTGSVVPAVSNIPTSRFPVDDIAPPHDLVSDWVDVDRNPLHQSTLPYIVLVLPLVVLSGLFAARKWMERIATDERFARSRRAHPAARKHLRHAEDLLAAGKGRDLYSEISQAVSGYIGDRYGLAPQGMTRDQLRQALLRHELPANLAESAVSILDECETAQFSPEAPDAKMMQDVIERAAGLIAGIHEELKRHGVAA